MTKSKLRKIYLAKQRALAADERVATSKAIADLFFRDVDLDRVNVLHCFIAIEKFNEIDTTIILQRLWKDHPQIETVVPRVNFATGEIENLKFTPDTALVKSIWDIHEPSHDEYVETTAVDMVLVPLLCFDRQGHRVGYGKGFYDRFLQGCRPDCKKTGLSYFPPVRAIDDAAAHDVKLDCCITPEGRSVFEKAIDS